MTFSLKRVVLLVVAIAVFAGELRAIEEAPHASKPEVRKEIVGVIDAQLAAFRASDLRKAYNYASTNLRAQKPLAAFTAIVQENYPEIWTNSRSEFSIVRDDGAEATVLVHVFGKDSDASYDYTLVKEKAGWRVAAVLRHAPKQSDRM